MYCNTCGNQFQPWVEIVHYTDERGKTPILVYEYCDWRCDSDCNYSFCINCRNQIPKRINSYLCKICQNILSGKGIIPEKSKEKIDPYQRYTNVYFFQLENAGPIKVGVSEKPLERLKQIQSANPYKVNCLFFFNTKYPVESYIRNKFKDSNLEGEWYKPSRKLLCLINKLKIGKALVIDARDLLI